MPIAIKKHKLFIPAQTRLTEVKYQPEYGTRCALCSTKNRQIRANWSTQHALFHFAWVKEKHVFKSITRAKTGSGI